MKSSIKDTFKATIFLYGLFVVASCSSQKDTAINRRLQNLSARYNYIYNAHNLLAEYEGSLAQYPTETFEDILPVYPVPSGDQAANDPSLKEIITKAQAIISEKNLSNYIDDAYLLLGQANFYQGNYFTATEYFNYVASTYSADKQVALKALTWKARSQYQLNNVKAMALILDSVASYLPLVKKDKAEALATLAQFKINQQKNEAAIDFLKAALKQHPGALEKSRWEYILGQLFELEKNHEESFKYFTGVVKSNAPFEMYFNANLNRIKLSGLITGKKLNLQDEILLLLKDDKNEDYKDQIYYKVAESYAESGNPEKAEAYYQLSVAESTKNQYQKGLSYLRIADLNFNGLGNYLKAKAYYDSAAITLPKTFPGYNQIVKKGENLEYLSKRFQSIAYQDSLQLIAALPEDNRLERIIRILGPEAQPGEPAPAEATNALLLNELNTPAVRGQVKSTFYFSNSAALSNGFSEFQKKWGNRPLQDNWRQSTKSAAEVVVQKQNAAIENANKPAGEDISSITSRVALIQRYLDDLPLTDVQLKSSNQKIIDTYFEIASFYQQELDDKEEAANIYERLLERFPGNNHLDAVFYSLYRIYQDSDERNAGYYKDLVLKNFPASVYAKTILDPSYSLKQNANELAVQKSYNAVYAGYENKSYDAVITQADAALASYPNNSLQSQYEYLKAIAIGRTNKVDTLLTVFNKIITTYPNDQVITPLVKDHIAYINAHLAEFKSREVALIDFDANEPRFIAQRPQNNAPVIRPAIVSAQAPKKQEIDSVITFKESSKVVEDTIPVRPAIKTDGTFTNAPSSAYYFVVNVADASLTLSSSRFGIGQFNRGNYPDDNFRHQLKELDNNQLIYVGNFPDFNAAQRYADIIIPQLKTIMKVPAVKVSTFIISKENFDKIESDDKINQYLKFFSNSY